MKFNSLCGHLQYIKMDKWKLEAPTNIYNILLIDINTDINK